MQLDELRPHFIASIQAMEKAFRRLEASVPPPRLVHLGGGVFAMRYKERLLEQALVQKLARVVSGLRAADLLLQAGHLQEQAVVHRTLDEINEDIAFLAVARTNDKETELHQRYLAAFWEEEFDQPGDPIASTQKRNYPRREKIRAYVHRILGDSSQQSAYAAVGETLSKAFSGFVHAASPQVMDMCGGDPPRFHVFGMLGTPRMHEHADDICNYFYRSWLSFEIVSKAFGDANLLAALRAVRSKFEEATGTDSDGKPRYSM